MPHDVKIATCCYCGARTVLKLTARGGHELACGNCGAPLHNMKPMKASERSKPTSQKPRSHKHAPVHHHEPYARKRKGDKRKRRKPLWQRGLEEAWDVIEDMFD